MSLELTDEERAKVNELANSDASFVVHTPRRFLPIILKLQAGKMKAEYRLKGYPYARTPGWTARSDAMADWTDDQWLAAAGKELGG